NDDALGIQQPHLIVRPHGPDPDILERREGGAAGFIELELEATGGRIELEGGRAGLVARGVGNLPGADHLLGGVARRRRLRAGADGGERKRDHSETSASRHGETRTRIAVTRTLSCRTRRVMPRPRARGQRCITCICRIYAASRRSVLILRSARVRRYHKVEGARARLEG